MRIAIAGSTGLVGRQVVQEAIAEGHEVVELARQTGVDLTSPLGLAERLAGVDAVIDVTQSPTLDEAESTAFFTTVAANLGTAATTAGVTRSVALSIIGVDVIPDYGYYVAKLAQERTTIQHAPDARILRAAQFLEFPGQMLEWNRDGDKVVIPEMKSQPVAVAEIAKHLVRLADGRIDASLVELAGPEAGELTDFVRRVAAAKGVDVEVTGVRASASMADGACLPGPDAIIAGPGFSEWLRDAV
ncbi:SDR family oxidoreductase [Pseudoclavibacter helvolus]|uniref:SDR family oxidoreductase n=1 Tax=Pseudoclavibacter helvolus TaxID=255205 RepID=UPI0024AE0FFD|nr:NAD(P)H-binding protein [Pseudoclavibacter helvolus]